MVVSRRRLLGNAAVVAGATVTLGTSPASATARCEVPKHPEAIIGRNDPRYAELVARGLNERFIGSPDFVQMVYTPAQIEHALEAAVRNKQSITVRSGGHCFDSLVDDPRFRVLLDVSEMNRIYFDPAMKAFAVESGATLAEVYRALYLGWGVTVPAGVCPSVGVGGHIAGGGYGPLSRKHGLSVDHLHAVEVVVVDRNGKAHTVVATRNADDPNRDLWWAHTGGGGGNFGIVTKYWFRTPGVTSDDPVKLLPKPPARLLNSWVTWSWEGMTEAGFTRLVNNHGNWHAANSAPGSRWAALHSALHLNTHAAQSIFLEVRMDAGVPNAERMLDEYIGAISDGVPVKPDVQTTNGLWLETSLTEWTDSSGSGRSKSKGGVLRKPWTANQVKALYRGLTDPSYKGWTTVYLAAYGCQVNTVAPSATAVAQRDSILKVWFSGGWADAAEDAAQIDWIRRFYRSVHEETGGVPVPNDNQDGSFINYPDVDLRDPNWNTSGVPWHTLYYKDNYPKLQRVKAKYDPLNVFGHALGIQA